MLKTITKRILSAVLVLGLILSIMPSGLLKAKAATYEKATFPMKYLNVTQGVNGYFSHLGTYALDLGGRDTGIDDVVAPFTGVIKKIYSPGNGNWVWLESSNPVEYTDGTIDYMTIMVVHDNNISDLWVGKLLKQGEVFYQEGTSGNAYGNHIHLECGRGRFSGSGWHATGTFTSSGLAIWTINNGIAPYNALFVRQDTIVYDSGGYNWRRCDVELLKPAIPNVQPKTAENIAVGSTITVTWQAVSGATSYSAGLYKGNALVGTEINVGTATRASFVVPDVGSYTIKVTAKNSAGTATGISGTFTAHNPSTVQFKDWDGTLLNEQSVNYGAAAVAPSTPSREGYDFIGWDKVFTNITSNLTVSANYKIKTFTIKFTDRNGQVLKTETVNYGSDATPPADPNPPIGFAFVNWANENYLNVKGNATIQGIYTWANPALPIVLNITSASRQPDGYYVYFNLTNYPDAITRGRAVVALKTAEGKLIDTTESAAFSVPAGGTKTGMEVFVPSDKAATQLEVMIVNRYSSGVPISAMKTAAINQEGMWSNWSTEEPTGTGITVETRTEYRYRDKDFETSTASNTMSGWTLYNTTSAWGEYGAWSAWQNTSVTATQSREVGTQTVPATYKTIYHYYHYCSGYNSWNYAVAGTNYCHITTSVPPNSSTQSGYDGIPYWNFSGCNYGGAKRFYPGTGYTGQPYYNSAETVVDKPAYQQWRYRDRSLVYTYCFYRWKNWSEFNPAQVTATNDREVETRTVYRYKSSEAATEDTTGIARTVAGNVDVSFAGKQAVLFIYKVDEASDFTNEFIGQTVIGEDGAYSFNFKLREEPSVKTGDFTVAIGIEGTTNIYVIDTIEAPKPVYTVEFYDYDGTLLSAQQIEQGAGAVIPANPSREGYTFVGWDTGTTNVRDNMVIRAVYAVNTYTVVFIDFTNDTVETRTFHYGDVLTGPEPQITEGYDFIGWDELLAGSTLVTSSMILTATYEKKTYNVVFYDFDLNVISTQTVAYDEPAQIPDDLQKDKYVFAGWENVENCFAVKQELAVKPLYYFEETVEEPVADIDSGVYSTDQIVTLACPTPGSEIYYTTDGSDPAVAGRKYMSPIAVTRSMELRFHAKAEKMNNSYTVKNFYAINKADMASAWYAYPDLPDYVLDNPANYDVVSETGYRYKDTQSTHIISEAVTMQMNGWTPDGETYGAFSEWSTDYPDTQGVWIEVESRDPDPVDTPFYRYEHWLYFDETSQTYKVSRTQIEGTTGEWEYVTLPNSLAVNSWEGGFARFLYNGVFWYTQAIVVIPVVPDYDLYRFRYIEHNFYKWTEWSIESPNPEETRETETAAVFCFTQPNRYLVTVNNSIEGGMYSENTILAEAGKPLTLDLNGYLGEGYDFLGFFTDEACTEAWDLENDVVSSNLTLYPKWAANEFAVSFIGYEGADLGTQTVVYGQSAAAPVPPDVADYTFLGWDKEFTNVTQELTVTAQYKLTVDVLKIELSLSKNIVSLDSMFRLTATVTPAAAENKAVVWSSGDESVAVVDQTGLVTAVGIGRAVITATTVVDGRSDYCEVIVYSNGEWNFDFDQSSSLRFIIGLTAVSKVSTVKTQILNSNIKFVDGLGQEMGENDIITTGCKVQMVENQTVVAEKTFVYFGDVNGDGSIDSIDAGIFVDYENYLINWDLSDDAAFLAAADLNGDGSIDSIDAGIAVDVENYLMVIDQTTGLAVPK